LKKGKEIEVSRKFTENIKNTHIDKKDFINNKNYLEKSSLIRETAVIEKGQNDRGMILGSLTGARSINDLGKEQKSEYIKESKEFERFSDVADWVNRDNHTSELAKEYDKNLKENEFKIDDPFKELEEQYKHQDKNTEKDRGIDMDMGF